MSDPRPIGTRTDFDPGSLAYINRFLLYRRAFGLIGEDVDGPWIQFDNLNRVEIPMGQSIRNAGFEPYQMVDLHTIFALTGRQDAPKESVISQTVLHPYSPPGCIQVCFQKRGKVKTIDGKRIIDMDGSQGGLKNGGMVTLPQGSTALDWVVEGVPYTVYEIYLITQIDTFPPERGRSLLMKLANLMNPGSSITS